MPGRRQFTPEELATSAAAGEPRLESDFDGDTDAYHAYQDHAVVRHLHGRGVAACP